MKVSIIIPAYNGERFLGPTIESVLSQTFVQWELIIVDDGSTDNTAALACTYADKDPRLRVIFQTNAGLANARNRGLAETDPSSEYIVFLDHDDVWEEDALEVLMSALSACPEATAASGLSRIIDHRGELSEPGAMETWGRHRMGIVGERLVSWPVDSPTTFAVLAFRNVIYTPGQGLIRRRALDAVGLFDPATEPCEDWDMWLRLSQLGPIVYVDQVILSWRKHDRNMSSQSEWLGQGISYVRRKLISLPGLNEEQRQLIRVANRFWGRQERSARLSWARQTLARGQVRNAGRELHRAAVSYLRCLQGLPAP